MNNLDLYKILRIYPGASEKEVEDAVSRMLRIWNPDDFEEYKSVAQKVYDDINRAKNILLDPTKRSPQNYDKTRKNNSLQSSEVEIYTNSGSRVKYKRPWVQNNKKQINNDEINDTNQNPVNAFCDMPQKHDNFFENTLLRSSKNSSSEDISCDFNSSQSDILVSVGGNLKASIRNNDNEAEKNFTQHKTVIRPPCLQSTNVEKSVNIKSAINNVKISSLNINNFEPERDSNSESLEEIALIVNKTLSDTNTTSSNDCNLNANNNTNMHDILKQIDCSNCCSDEIKDICSDEKESLENSDELYRNKNTTGHLKHDNISHAINNETYVVKSEKLHPIEADLNLNCLPKNKSINKHQSSYHSLSYKTRKEKLVDNENDNDFITVHKNLKTSLSEKAGLNLQSINKYGYTQPSSLVGENIDIERKSDSNIFKKRSSFETNCTENFNIENEFDKYNKSVLQTNADLSTKSISPNDFLKFYSLENSNEVFSINNTSGYLDKKKIINKQKYASDTEVSNQIVNETMATSNSKTQSDDQVIRRQISIFPIPICDPDNHEVNIKSFKNISKNSVSDSNMETDLNHEKISTDDVKRSKETFDFKVVDENKIDCEMKNNSNLSKCEKKQFQTPDFPKPKQENEIDFEALKTDLHSTMVTGSPDSTEITTNFFKSVKVATNSSAAIKGFDGFLNSFQKSDVIDHSAKKSKSENEVLHKTFLNASPFPDNQYTKSKSYANIYEKAPLSMESNSIQKRKGVDVTDMNKSSKASINKVSDDIPLVGYEPKLEVEVPLNNKQISANNTKKDIQNEQQPILIVKNSNKQSSDFCLQLSNIYKHPKASELNIHEDKCQDVSAINASNKMIRIKEGCDMKCTTWTNMQGKPKIDISKLKTVSKTTYFKEQELHVITSCIHLDCLEMVIIYRYNDEFESLAVYLEGNLAFRIENGEPVDVSAQYWKTIENITLTMTIIMKVNNKILKIINIRGKGVGCIKVLRNDILVYCLENQMVND